MSRAVKTGGLNPYRALVGVRRRSTPWVKVCAALLAMWLGGCAEPGLAPPSEDAPSPPPPEPMRLMLLPLQAEQPSPEDEQAAEIVRRFVADRSISTMTLTQSQPPDARLDPSALGGARLLATLGAQSALQLRIENVGGIKKATLSLYEPPGLTPVWRQSGRYVAQRDMSIVLRVLLDRLNRQLGDAVWVQLAFPAGSQPMARAQGEEDAVEQGGVGAALGRVEHLNESVNTLPLPAFLNAKLAGSLPPPQSPAPAAKTPQQGVPTTQASESAASSPAHSAEPPVDAAPQNLAQIVRYEAQLGAFASPAGAERMVTALGKLGLKGRIRPREDSRGKVWQVVWCGPYRQAQEAHVVRKFVAAKLKAEGYVRRINEPTLLRLPIQPPFVTPAAAAIKGSAP
ncbi:SPOR domain-containing protein [Magnetofaba australis]|nr:SPOR domain-containing protein [Magnetofaba australis]